MSIDKLFQFYLRFFLCMLGINDLYIPEQILVHDEVNIEPRNNPCFDIPFFSVFAVDHLLWGIEREKILWTGWDKNSIRPDKAIHDYQSLIRMKNSPNLQETN